MVCRNNIMVLWAANSMVVNRDLCCLYSKAAKRLSALLSPAEEWLVRVEMERHAIKHAPTEQNGVESRELRDKLYFNAGRYAAGQRDKVAQIAWQAIGETIE
jgi:hypothetical protein